MVEALQMVQQVSWEFQTLQPGKWFTFFRDYTIATLNFLRSPIGRLTLSVREDEIAAESVGVNTTKSKLSPSSLELLLQVLQGSLQAGFIGSVVPRITALSTLSTFDHRCLWWTWDHYRCNCFCDCSWNFEYASSKMLLAFV